MLRVKKPLREVMGWRQDPSLLPPPGYFAQLSHRTELSVLCSLLGLHIIGGAINYCITSGFIVFIAFLIKRG